MTTPSFTTLARRQIRQQRRQLTARTRQQAGRQVCHRLRRSHLLKHAQQVGIYLDAYGEVPTGALIDLCFKLHKQVYLPKIRPMDQKLIWCKITRQQWRNRRMAKHPLGMQQPQQRAQAVNFLDLLIIPLVLFDYSGTRVGMGGGYYDRTLWKTSRPVRLGLAYDFQQVDGLHRQPWDQPLHAVLTPSRLCQMGRKRHW